MQIRFGRLGERFSCFSFRWKRLFVYLFVFKYILSNRILTVAVYFSPPRSYIQARWTPDPGSLTKIVCFCFVGHLKLQRGAKVDKHGKTI